MNEHFATAEKVNLDTPYKSGTSTGPDSPPPNSNVSNNVISKKPISEYKEADESDKYKLTDSEAKLFNQLKNNDLNDKNLNKLIDSGVITEKLIEKFIEYVDNLPPQNLTLADVINVNKKKQEEKFTTVNKFAYV